MNSVKSFRNEIRQAILCETAAWHRLKDLAHEDLHYRGLMSLFQLAQAAGMTDEHLFGCASAVYGMMPCMLGNAGRLGKRSEHQFVAIDSARLAIRGQAEINLQPFINGSWVGTAKFMHFIDPLQYFIFDSRVARAMRGKSTLHFKNWGDYLNYCEAMSELMTNMEIADALAFQFDRIKGGHRFVGGRRLEIALYAIGGD